MALAFAPNTAVITGKTSGGFFGPSSEDPSDPVRCYAEGGPVTVLTATGEMVSASWTVHFEPDVDLAVGYLVAVGTNPPAEVLQVKRFDTGGILPLDHIEVILK